ncbi:hypothetical protein ACFL3F_02560 [Planctomycetota bacterium]
MANRHRIRITMGCMLAVLAYVHYVLPGCAGRRFLPVRDPHQNVLQVFHIEVPEYVGRGHPDIDDVLRQRRVSVLTKFPPIKLMVGEETVFSKVDGDWRVVLTSQDEDYAEIKLKGGILSNEQPFPPGSDESEYQHLRIPLDTWSVLGAQVTAELETVRLFILRLNRPGP